MITSARSAENVEVLTSGATRRDGPLPVRPVPVRPVPVQDNHGGVVPTSLRTALRGLLGLGPSRINVGVEQFLQ